MTQLFNSGAGDLKSDQQYTLKCKLEHTTLRQVGEGVQIELTVYPPPVNHAIQLEFRTERGNVAVGGANFAKLDALGKAHVTVKCTRLGSEGQVAIIANLLKPNGQLLQQVWGDNRIMFKPLQGVSIGGSTPKPPASPKPAIKPGTITY